MENQLEIIETSNGLTARYNGRFLYSKYAPKKSILATIDSLGDILPGTLFVATSCVLGYGLKELLLKIHDNDSFVIITECNSDLFFAASKYCNFNLNETAESSQNNKDLIECIQNKTFDAKNSLLGKFLVLPQSDWDIFIDEVTRRQGKFFARFKRVLRVDLSAASILNDKKYSEFIKRIQDAITLTYKNRATLIKFGKRYCVNFFRNLVIYYKSRSLNAAECFNKVTKPILVLGASQSIEQLLNKKTRDTLSDYFIIAVDAALPFLRSIGFAVDIAITEDAQIGIRKMLVGCNKIVKNYFHSLSSCPVNISGHLDSKLHHDIKQPVNYNSQYFYTTKFFDANFLATLNNNGLLPYFIEPLGSVGLTAVYIAQKLRETSDVPIFIMGLDFDFETGKTHGRGTYQMNRYAMDNNRLTSYGNYDTFVSKKLLQGYADLFKRLFFKVENLFDLRGEYKKIALDVKEVTNISEISKIYSTDKINFAKNTLFRGVPSNDLQKKEKACIKKYFNDELEVLQKISKLYNENNSSALKELLPNREYLYLHFADWVDFVHSKKYDKSFCKRIFAECGYFKHLFLQLLNTL